MTEKRFTRFQLSDASECMAPFIIILHDGAKIRHARRILAGEEKSKVHISGTIVKSTAPYNSDWPFHIYPESIDFFEYSIEVCDATMEFVAENLGDVGGSTLPNNHWCPWTSKLVGEI